jgi:putative alpha-1,2-mannosidase
VRRALLELYKPTPGGMPGNDDGGTMSAWWVFGALGFYPSVPGEDTLALASPLFRRAAMNTGRGKIRIEAPKAAPKRPLVRRVRLGRRILTEPFLRFSQIARGARLRFDLR